MKSDIEKKINELNVEIKSLKLQIKVLSIARILFLISVVMFFITAYMANIGKWKDFYVFCSLIPLFITSILSGFSRRRSNHISVSSKVRRVRELGKEISKLKSLL